MSSVYVLLYILEVFGMIRIADAGYCINTFSCSFGYYTSEKTSKECGFWNWSRCTKYKSSHATGYRTCYRKECCSGYTDPYCSKAICFGSLSCPNGGTCILPNYCSCPSGFSGSRCSDTDECSIGTSDCEQRCINTFGSYNCECRPGYSLNWDKKTCSDVDECSLGQDNRQHLCINTRGSFACSCRSGYTISSNGASCIDIDECSNNRGGCSHFCRNLDGSFECYCNSGYQVDNDKLTCVDIDECVLNNGGCELICVNEPGTFHCLCGSGYTIDSNGKACKDIDECSNNNGGCEHLCVNEPGSHRCECNSGYSIGPNGTSCEDKDECSFLNGGCEQSCVNEIGSFYCNCSVGYILGTDGKTCTDIDDCSGVICLNVGTCYDLISSYGCKCQPGYEGKHCETDINECLTLNGGCEDQCINTNGSYYCQCRNDSFLDEDGFSCRGDRQTPNVFELYNIHQRLLPRGCMYIKLTSCGINGGTTDVHLSSTDSWYQLEQNPNILFTDGIVFAELNDFSIPVSITGVTVTTSATSFDLTLGSNMYSKNETKTLNNSHSGHCLSFQTNPRDIFDFVNSGSFLRTVFERMRSKLPNWLSFGKSGAGLLSVTDLRTDVSFGSSIDTFPECIGAPVLSNRLYSVFRFNADTSVSIYGNRIIIPKPLDGSKFCFIIDLCQSLGGTVFLMLPTESRNLLDDFDFFKAIYSYQSVRFRPKGIGFSLANDINVHYRTTSLTLWNGDQLFQYPVFSTAGVWLGANVEWKSISGVFDISVNADADVFLSVPGLKAIFLDIFVEEWSGLIQLKKIAATSTFRFVLFDKFPIEWTMKDVLLASIEIMWSIGGTGDRIWCGDGANPPGLFISFLANVNPFRQIPIIGDWLLSANSKVHVFLTTEDKLSLDTTVDVLNEILEIKSMTQRFNLIIKDVLKETTNFTRNHLTVFQSSLFSFELTLSEAVNFKTNLRDMLRFTKLLWEDYSVKVKDASDIVMNELEFIKSSVISDLKQLIESETHRIGRNVDQIVSKISNKIFSLYKSITGFGFHLSLYVRVLGLEFSLMDVEFVYSNNIGRCSRYKKLYELLEGENALRLLCRSTVRRQLGYFITLEASQYVSIAFSFNLKVIAHFHSQISVLGTTISADVIVSNTGLYFSFEGNIWDIFLAKVEFTTTVDVDRSWFDLIFNVKGSFIAASYDKNMKNFQGSYLDGLRLFARKVAESANKRLSAAQDGLSSAQTSLSFAQSKLTDAQNAIKKCRAAFDNAISALNSAKNKLEEAKLPYEIALNRLRQAQRDVDNLCKIRECRPLCIPGIRCRWCSWDWLTYPCCGWTNCMIEIPDLFCLAANAFCRIIRGVAYAALEFAKQFVRLPMLIYDAAKLALTLAQVVVDKSRAVLWVAEGVLDIAKYGLEVTKGALEIAKQAIEVIKFAVKAALYVFDLISRGIQNLIDVKNCGFEIEISTSDSSFFDVSCDVKAFGLGWTTFRFSFDFRNPLSSIWRVAKATINSLLDMISEVFGKRKRRDITFKSMNILHHALDINKREIRNETSSQTLYLNDTLFDESADDNTGQYSSYKYRVTWFATNCANFQKITSFLSGAVFALTAMVNETVSVFNDVSSNKEMIANVSINSTLQNMTAESLGVSPEYALNDYNITSEELESHIQDFNASFMNDPVIMEISNATKAAEEIIDSGVNEAYSIQIVHYWLYGMDNETRVYFESSECYDFRDCVLYSFFVLYDLFNNNSTENAELNQNLTSTMEDSFLDLFLNTSRTPIEVHHMSQEIMEILTSLNESTQFCSTPPNITVDLRNQTVLKGSRLSFVCNVTGNPKPMIWWYYNDTYIEGMNDDELEYLNATEMHIGKYRCVAGNIVTNVTSTDAYVTVKECRSGTYFHEGYCIECGKGEYQENRNQEFCFSCMTGYTTDSPGSDSSTSCIAEVSVIKLLWLTILGFAFTVAVIFVICVKRKRKRKTYKLGSLPSGCTTPA